LKILHDTVRFIVFISPLVTIRTSYCNVSLLSVHCRVQLDSSLRCTRSNVVLKSTHYCTVFYVCFPQTSLI